MEMEIKLALVQEQRDHSIMTSMCTRAGEKKQELMVNIKV
jgi:hypothetical protein